jgi:hypothetical protein
MTEIQDKAVKNPLRLINRLTDSEAGWAVKLLIGFLAVHLAVKLGCFIVCTRLFYLLVDCLAVRIEVAVEEGSRAFAREASSGVQLGSSWAMWYTSCGSGRSRWAATSSSSKVLLGGTSSREAAASSSAEVLLMGTSSHQAAASSSAKALFGRASSHQAAAPSSAKDRRQRPSSRGSGVVIGKGPLRGIISSSSSVAIGKGPPWGSPSRQAAVSSSAKALLNRYRPVLLLLASSSARAWAERVLNKETQQLPLPYQEQGSGIRRRNIRRSSNTASSSSNTAPSSSSPSFSASAPSNADSSSNTEAILEEAIILLLPLRLTLLILPLPPPPSSASSSSNTAHLRGRNRETSCMSCAGRRSRSTAPDDRRRRPRYCTSCTWDGPISSCRTGREKPKKT